CVRCRRQKIKCGGKHPCEPCKRRRIRCDYEAEEPKVFISKRYISDLEEKIALLEAQLESPPGSARMRSTRSHSVYEYAQHQPASEEEEGDEQYEDQQEVVQICDPLLASGYLTHVTNKKGTPCHSSNYSFTQRILRLLHCRLSCEPYPPSEWHPCGSYEFGWDKQDISVEAEIGGLPSKDHALYLLSAVKFRAGQIYHLYDEEFFMSQLDQFYLSPAENVSNMKVWYIHFLVLLAFGKAFVVCDADGRRPPGSYLFLRAVKLLPDATYLISDFITATEILCCMALYYQALDGRVAAYEKIGQATRMGLTMGMHTCMQPDSLDETLIQRCRKVWWTVVVLDRQISGLLGLPIQVRDDDIATPFPIFPDSEQQAAASKLQIGLSRALAQVVKTVYCSDTKHDVSFISRTQDALRYVASVAHGLNTYFPLPDRASGDGISPIPGHLNILYHQCIVVATRPFLSIVLKKWVKGPEDKVSSLLCGDPIRHILVVGVESAKRISSILCSLRDQDLIETFLPFQLESAFSAATVLAIAATHFSSMFDYDDSSFQDIIEVLQLMISKGNAPAAERLSELQRLRQMLDERRESFLGPHPSAIQAKELTPESGGENDTTTQISPTTRNLHGSLALALDWGEGPSFEGFYSEPQNLNAIAESLNFWDSTDWFPMISDEVFQQMSNQETLYSPRVYR
ncbi:hypothetical protein N7456_006312, partial [Penicillium angulare]